MQNITAVLLQLVGIDRKGFHVAMLNKNLSLLTRLRVVERAIRINALIHVMKQRFTQDVLGIIMLVIPYQRHFHAIALFECTSSNHTTIRTLQVITSGPSRKIVILHFDLYPPSLKIYVLSLLINELMGIANRSTIPALVEFCFVFLVSLVAEGAVGVPDPGTTSCLA